MVRARKRKPIPFVIGVDVGGSRIRMAAVNRRGQILGTVLDREVSTREKDGLIKQLIEMVWEMNRSSAVGGSGRVQGRPRAIGIGLPGFLLKEAGVIYASPNFPGWYRVPFRNLLSSALPLSLVVENDANAAALGEAWKGRGRNVQTLLYLGLGTGVGGGVVLNRQLWRGSDGLAGELGHMTVDPRGPICGCGNSGCLEAYASATALVRGYLEMKKELRKVAPSTAEISRAARRGDPAARAVFARAGKALGIAIASLINIFNPQMVVIGGGVSVAWNLFSSAMRTELVKRAIRPARLRARVVRGRLGNRAGILGAAACAWRHEGVEIF